MNIRDIAQTLLIKRNGKHPEVPLQYEVEHFGNEVRRILFPHYSESQISDITELDAALTSLTEVACKALERQGEEKTRIRSATLRRVH